MKLSIITMLILILNTTKPTNALPLPNNKSGVSNALKTTGIVAAPIITLGGILSAAYIWRNNYRKKNPRANGIRSHKNGLASQQGQEDSDVTKYRPPTAQDKMDATIFFNLLTEKIKQGSVSGILDFHGLDCSTASALTKEQRASIVKSITNTKISYVTFGEDIGLNNWPQAQVLYGLIRDLRNVGWGSEGYMSYLHSTDGIPSDIDPRKVKLPSIDTI